MTERAQKWESRLALFLSLVTLAGTAFGFVYKGGQLIATLDRVVADQTDLRSRFEKADREGTEYGRTSRAMIDLQNRALSEQGRELKKINENLGEIKSDIRVMRERMGNGKPGPQAEALLKP